MSDQMVRPDRSGRNVADVERILECLGWLLGFRGEGRLRRLNVRRKVKGEYLVRGSLR